MFLTYKLQKHEKTILPKTFKKYNTYTARIKHFLIIMMITIALCVVVYSHYFHLATLIKNIVRFKSSRYKDFLMILHFLT